MKTIASIQLRIKTSLLIISALLILCTPPAFAQTEDAPGATPEERARQWTDWMKAELELTAEQEPQVHDINLKYARQAEALKGKEGSRMSKFKELKSGDSDKDEALKQVLTPAQFSTYLDKKQSRQKKMLKSLKDK